MIGRVSSYARCKFSKFYVVSTTALLSRAMATPIESSDPNTEPEVQLPANRFALELEFGTWKGFH